ncbi:glycosyltransferase family 4 protein [Roseivirga sp.]|uniref:glycosyltransferase family 4 protein n=1 Tax=Roseivirga sp. TaxID=1964215 RepID=UPI003B519B46
MGNKSLNILLIAKTLPWQFKGGIQTHTWELARSMNDLGHQVSILNGGPFFSKQKSYTKKGIEVIQVPYFPGRYLKPVSLLAEELSFNWVVLRWVRKNHKQYDIIHSQGRSGYLLSYYSQIRNRLVNTVHGLIDIENQDKKWYQLNYNLHHTFTRKVEDRLYKHAAGLVAVSNALKDELYVRRELKKDISVISNGVKGLNLPRVLQCSTQSRFLFVGRLHPIKGITEIVNQMDLADEHVFLDIIGDGSEKEKIKQIIDRKGLSKKVRLLGEYSNEEIHSLLPYYTALVLPSHYETQGIVLLEANSEGVPVIASDLPSIRETITHGENGMLCPVDDPASFIKAMNYMTHNTQDARHMGIVGQMRVKSDYSWHKVAEKTTSLYYTLKNEEAVQ